MRRGAPSLFLPLLLAAALARPLAAAEPDLAAPELQALRRTYLARRAELDQARRTDHEAMLQAELAEARERLARARVSGNTPGLASARFSEKLFTDALAELKEKGAFTFPEKVRRELEERVDACRRRQQAAEEAFTAAVRTLDGEFAAQLQPLLAAQQADAADDDGRRAVLARLVEAAAPAPAEPPAPTNAVENAATAAVTNAVPAAPPVPALPDVLASHGSAVDWVPLARLDVEVNALEILAVPLAGLTAPRTVEGTGMISAQPHRTVVTPRQELVAGGPALAARLRSVPGAGGLDVMAWPSPRNDWTLEVRARPTGGIPSRHAAEIEVAAGSPAVRPLPGAADASSGGATSETAVARVSVQLTSEPPEAFVTVNGSLLAMNGRALKTPFAFELPARPLEIRFHKAGYKEALFKAATPRAGGTLIARLVRDPEYVNESVTVPANGKGWLVTRIRVRAGQSVQLAATGSWNCGSGREKVDAGGYPNETRFFKYYLDPVQHPRQLAGANYGALLVRVAPDGEPQAVGASGSFRAPADGVLAFDINEAPAARHDNGGAVAVQVQIAPVRR